MPADSASSLLSDALLDKLISAGADAADVMIVKSESLSLTWRNGAIDTLESAEVEEVGLRAFIGQKQSVIASTDLRTDSLADLVSQVISMARMAPDDPFCGLADETQITSSIADLSLCDQKERTADDLCCAAREMEAAALSVKGVTQCEETGAYTSRSTVTIAASNGFSGTWLRSGSGLYAAALAGSGTSMVRDDHNKSRIFWDDLPPPDNIGRKAGERAASALNARKIGSKSLTVVFEPRVARSLVSHLLSAISGPSIARGTSFLKDKLDKIVFPQNINIEDNPSLLRGRGSRVVDAEGIATKKRNLVDDGRLCTWLLDCRSARQLGMIPTGHASSAPGVLPYPSTHNVIMRGEDISPEKLLLEVRDGIYITELMGMGVNGITGDYSRAARGFMIENGEITYPVHEIALAGNLIDMFARMRVANDKDDYPDVETPTIMIDGMTVAGI